MRTTHTVIVTLEYDEPVSAQFACNEMAFRLDGSEPDFEPIKALWLVTHSRGGVLGSGERSLTNEGDGKGPRDDA